MDAKVTVSLERQPEDLIRIKCERGLGGAYLAAATQIWPADFELVQHATAFMMPNPRVEIINVCVKLPYTDQVDSSEEAVMGP